MTVGVINKTLIASFVFNHPVGGMESVTLDISENNILPGKPFLVEISRLTVNITLVIHSNNCSLRNNFFLISELTKICISLYKIFKLKVYTAHLAQSLACWLHFFKQRLPGTLALVWVEHLQAVFR